MESSFARVTFTPPPPEKSSKVSFDGNLHYTVYYEDNKIVEIRNCYNHAIDKRSYMWQVLIRKAAIQ